MANPFDIAEGKPSAGNPFDEAEKGTASDTLDFSKLKLNPYDEYYRLHGRSGGIGPTGIPMGSENFGSGDPVKALKLGYEIPGAALTYAGNVARAIPADVAAGLRGESEYSGNLPAAITADKLPIDTALDESAKESALQGGNGWESTLGHVSQDVAASAPLLLAGAGAPAAIQRALLAGFTAKMIADTPEIAREYGEELGKNKEDQDPAKIARLRASAIGTAGSVGLGALGLKGAGRDVPITLGDRIRMFERDIPTKELPDLSFREPNRRLGLQLNPNALDRPGVPEIVEQGLKEAQPGNITVPGEVPAVDLLRLQEPLLSTPDRSLMQRPGAESLPTQERLKYQFRTPEENEASLRSAENIRLEQGGGIPKREGKSGGPETTYEVPSKSVEEQLLGEKGKNASGQPKAAEVYGDVRPPTGEGPGQVPPENSGGGVQPRRPPNGGGDAGRSEQVPVSKAVTEFTDALNNPEAMKGGNKLSTAAGLKLNSVADLNALAELRRSQVKANNEFRSSLDALPKEQRMEKFQEWYKTAPDQRAQLAREAIEVATDTGSWMESETKVGKRPLDWKNNPEVADWLKANAEDLNIKLPDDFKRGPAAEPPLEVEGVTSLDPQSGTPLSATDALINKLESLKVAEDSGAKLYSLPHPDAIAAIGKTAWNNAIDVTVGAIKAGRAVKDAITEAIDYLKKNASAFDEGKTRLNLEKLMEFEAPKAGAAAPTAGARPVAPVPGAAPARGAGLDDVYKIFESDKKPGKSLRQIGSDVVEAFRTGVSSRYRPLQKLAEDIGKQYGVPTKGVAGIFEQLKGSSGKGDADVYRFDKDVSDAVKGSEKDFSAYLFLRRGIDRLQSDLADIRTAQAGGTVKTLNRRAVSDYTIPELQGKLATLEAKLGPEKLTQFKTAADSYQQHMDKALRLQVESGRMSPEIYDAIKKGNQFYAPFKVMKYIEETARPEGSGRRVDTLADFTKAMEGIESPDFKLGDMLAAARQNILMSRTLAEKNYAMRNISDLAAIDTDKLFVRKLGRNEQPPKGMEAVNVLEAGKPTKYAVDPSVAQSVQLFSGNANNIIAQALAKGAIPFRAGATALNLPFQVSNLLADVPRQALVSKYGIRGVNDLVRYPLDFIHSVMSSIGGDVFGYRSKLFQDFLDSGAAGSTVQEHLTPQALRAAPPSTAGKVAHKILYSVPDFANAIEQTSKILGVKRAMRFEGVESGQQLARQIPDAVTEIRRFSGSPDFGRQGKWVEQARLNLLYMFLNARIQGTVADLGRLTGRDGAGTAAKTWMKVLPAVGLPTAYLYMLNNSDKYAKDYEQRPQQEKQNYWLIPKDNFIKATDGTQIRDYWRIPKRESSKWVANMVESGLNFAEKRTPETFARWAQGMMEDISPVNIQGNTAQERLESTASSIHPFIKAPLEVATGRDFYRHKNIVPDTQKKASPEMQFTDRTPEIFKKAAEAMPNVAFEFMRSPLMLENMTRNLTAGLITQFLPRKPVEGRSGVENNPLMQRFQAVPYTDSSAFEERMAGLERDSADDQLTRYRAATKLVDENPKASIQDIARKMVQQNGPDKKLLERVVDVWTANQRGITPQERRILALPTAQRAMYVTDELTRLTDPQEKAAALREFALKRILTEGVAEEMVRQKEK